MMNITNHFLVAMPTMRSSDLERSVIYMCEHNEKGSMGLELTQANDLTIGEMLIKADVEPIYPQNKPQSLSQPVLLGGMTEQDRGFIVHCPKDEYQASVKMTKDITITSSKDLLEVLGTEEEPSHYVIALGYMAWEAGELEQELMDNHWLLIEVDPQIIFDTPIEKRWEKALGLLGVEPAKLSFQVGEA